MWTFSLTDNLYEMSSYFLWKITTSILECHLLQIGLALLCCLLKASGVKLQSYDIEDYIWSANIEGPDQMMEA